MILLVDIGNTRAKWVQMNDVSWSVQHFVLEPLEFEEQLASAWGDIPKPTKICVVCVAAGDLADRLRGWCHQQWGIKPVFAKTHAEQLGLRNHYDDPATLGCDRWLNLLATRHLLAGKVCVVDCGSAVTIDALSDDNQFIGGVIFPGLNMMRKSLVKETAAIKLAHSQADVFPARNTTDGVNSGTLMAMRGAIRDIINKFREKLGNDMSILFTGGDARYIAEGFGEEVRIELDMVLRGLALIANKL